MQYAVKNILIVLLLGLHKYLRRTHSRHDHFPRDGVSKNRGISKILTVILNINIEKKDVFGFCKIIRNTSRGSKLL